MSNNVHLKLNNTNLSKNLVFTSFLLLFIIRILVLLIRLRVFNALNVVNFAYWSMWLRQFHVILIKIVCRLFERTTR
jgi:hypothetical protein